MSEANRITNKNEIKHHNMTSKTGSKPYLYPSCGKRYFSKSDFARHFRTHTVENAFKCQICEKTFSRQSALKEHMNSHMGLKPHICNVCNDGFSTRRALLYHVATHTNEQTQPHVYDPDHYPITILTEKDRRSYECNICKKTFSREYTIMKHLSSFTGMNVNCKLCGKGFFTNRNLESHLQTVHKDECLFKCSVCEMGFPQQDLLEGHYKSTHTPDSKPYKCKVCNFGFNIHSRLKAHMMKHTNERPFTCNKCNKTFKLETTLRLHLERHKRTYVCQQCDKVCKSKEALRRHNKIHTGERPHVCLWCCARFVWKHNLKRHLKRHEKQDKYEERMKNEFKLITQSQQQYHNVTVNSEETEVNVNAQEIDGEALKIQDALETSMTPLAADSKEPVYNLGELTYDVVWIDSESFSTINAIDWNSLGGQEKNPEEVETDSV
ncbi:unnamed protein product [Orchesella dallaii]|uniref:C2H2-type domain-containing protein n=1 Tax=Orchesella dallaii TaxID=48710 RepID=A0ABP1S1Q9_9HEXA